VEQTNLSRNNEPAQDASGEPDQQSQEPKPELPSVSAKPKPEPAEAHDQITCKTEKNWWDKAKPFVEISGIALLALYTGFTVGSYCQIKKQTPRIAESADAAKKAADTAYAVQRPWVGVSDAPTYKTTQSDPSHRVREFSVAIKNFGTSPALKVAVVAQPGKPEQFRKGIDGICSQARDFSKNSFYLIPNEPYKQTHRSFDVSIAEGGPLQDNSVPALLGCIVYSDALGGPHHTEFCYMTDAWSTTQDTLSQRCMVRQDAD